MQQRLKTKKIHTYRILFKLHLILTSKTLDSLINAEKMLIFNYISINIQLQTDYNSVIFQLI